MNIESNNSIKCNVAIQGLYDVIDPEIGLNIVDLGLVYRIDFEEKSNHIVVSMTLTTQFCPMGESIVEATTQSMQQSCPESSIQVDLTFEPPWSQEMISEEGRNFLNF